MITKFNHVAIVVPNLDEAAQKYKTVLGAKVSKPYDYLIKSINEFYTQDELTNLIRKNGFSNVEYRNLSNGISAIHSGWKI